MTWSNPAIKFLINPSPRGDEELDCHPHLAQLSEPVSRNDPINNPIQPCMLLDRVHTSSLPLAYWVPHRITRVVAYHWLLTTGT